MSGQNFNGRKTKRSLNHAGHAWSGKVALGRRYGQHADLFSWNEGTVKALLCSVGCHLRVAVSGFLVGINGVVPRFNLVGLLYLNP